MKSIGELDDLLRAAEPLIELAVVEDIGAGDATSDATLGAEEMAVGRLVAKVAGVIAGLPVAEAVFRRVEPDVRFVAHVHEGQEVQPGELLAEVSGPARGLLAAERIALNFLQRMSGIATLTARFVDAVACWDTEIMDTRKTLPGYRVLDKYAVRAGGGTNHRMSLQDMILIKDNHIDSGGGIVPAVAAARASFPHLPVEVEVRTLRELREALAIDPPPDRIMLDNMRLQQMRRAVELAAGRVQLEASGNVTLARVGRIAATGVDYVSVGELTHSVRALDISMDVMAEDESASRRALVERVADRKRSLGDRVVILGHHYERDEVIAQADYRGDSLQLAREAVKTDARYIVFCGVHFMAETAAILAKPGQHAVIPDPSAGCYLADTATPGAVQDAWEHLGSVYGDLQARVTPITYVNSSAELKAFCGRHGGIVCTSSNAGQALRWALERGEWAFFFPDQHLGRNTARRLGIPLEQMVLWDVRRPSETQALLEAKVILWSGACNVHQRFRPEHVRRMRERYPSIRVIVHPECKMEVVDLADDAGSTGHIINQIREAPAGSQWAIGTESRLVHRLQEEHAEQFIVSLADVPPYCRTMSQITLNHLADQLSALARDQITHEVVVDTEIAQWAQVALERMLELG